MANSPKLNPEILKHLRTRLEKSESTIRSDISRLRRNFPQSTLNAVAQIYAEQHGESVRRLISKEDKSTIPAVNIQKVPKLKSKRRTIAREGIKDVMDFETKDPFLRKHIAEINRAYTKRCYTCVFVLTRKVLENLIVGILRTKYPANRELYFDTTRGRNHDFSVVLDNLYKKRQEFDNERKEAIERLHQKLKPFKRDANDKAHSLYHIVENSAEIDDWNIDTIMALVREIREGGPNETS